MEKWIYVEARQIDGNCSFVHVFVKAETETSAYDLGFLKMRG